MSTRRAFATIDPNYFEGGKPRYQTYGAHPWTVIEDLASDAAKETWKRYHGYFDAESGVWREGPLLFRSNTEKREYYRTYGFRANDRGEVDETAYRKVRREQKERRPDRRRQILETMQAYGFNDTFSRLSRDRHNVRRQKP